MKKCKVILVQLLIIATILMMNSVYAASATIGLSLTGSTVKKGNTVTATLSLKNFGTSEKVGTIEGYINYDTSVFETITIDSIQKNSDGTVTIGTEKLKVEDITNGNISSSSAYVAFNGKPRGSENNSKIIIDLADSVSSNIDLLKIDFKVKSDISEGQVQNAISFSKFVLFSPSGDRMTSEITQTADITVTSAGTTTPDNPDNPNNPNDDDNDNPGNNGNDNNNGNTGNNNNGNNSSGNGNGSGNNNNNNGNNNGNNGGSGNNNNTNSSGNGSGNSNNNGNTNGNVASRSGSRNDDGQATGSLPATGAKMLIIPVIALIVIAVISYNKYKKYKDI